METHCDKFLLSIGAKAVHIIEDFSFNKLQSFLILYVWEDACGRFLIYLFLASLYIEQILLYLPAWTPEFLT